MGIQKIVSMSLVSALLVFSTTVFALEKTKQMTPTHATTTQMATQTTMQNQTAYIPTPQEDMVITNSIKKHIGESAVLRQFKIDVRTQKGVVTLTGNVNSNIQARNLIELAQSIIGVRDVNSKLTVQKSQQVLADTIITGKIKGLFIREALFGTKPGVDMMNVETKNGIVYLSGPINNKEEVKKAIELIKGVKGVKSVEYKFSKIVPINTLNKK